MEPVSLGAWLSIVGVFVLCGAVIGWFTRSLIANRNEARLERVIEGLLDDVNRFHLDGDFEGIPAKL